MIVYEVADGKYLPVSDAAEKVYLNITNRCNNDCAFCLRKLKTQGLWLEREPTLEEVKAELDKLNWEALREVVVCGYGEPTCRQAELVEILKYVKRHKVKTRLNTNGLGNLENGRDISGEFAGILDEVSISQNASSAEGYLRITRSKYGMAAYGAMLEFADAMKKLSRVTLTVVDKVTSAAEIEKCRKTAELHGVGFRVRAFEE